MFGQTIRITVISLLLAAVPVSHSFAQGSADAGRQQAAALAPLVDEPWTPTSTGTVSPGMTREQVIAVWGQPVVERGAGAWMYLYFRNGYEVTCGTFDVVFLQDGQVVDAIVRGEGHTYAGVSSSPAGRVAEPTLPGTSRVPGD